MMNLNNNFLHVEQFEHCITDIRIDLSFEEPEGFVFEMIICEVRSDTVPDMSRMVMALYLHLIRLHSTVELYLVAMVILTSM